MRAPVVGSRTPWGFTDFVEVVAEGIVAVGTPSHGGYWISRERREAMPEPYRSRETWVEKSMGLENWYEEDCDWCMVVLSFPDLFDAETRAAAARNWEGWLKNR